MKTVRQLAMWVIVAYIWATVLPLSATREVTPHLDAVYIEGKLKSFSTIK